LVLYGQAEGGALQAEDIGSRAAGVLCVVVGTGLTVWAWRSAMGAGQYGLKAAIIAPTVLVLGVGLLIHGKGIPTSGATRLTRIYGLVGGVATIINLYLLGFFQRPVKHRSVWLMESVLPFLLLLVWALPSRFFGGPSSPVVKHAQPAASSPPKPIEPR
jgi:hypothetical protein